jgi:peptidoglycan-N-acetylglucosamine deacetylase
VQPDGVFRIATSEPVVGLTFDDGPDPRYTPSVISMLAEAEVRATFFLVGVNALASRSLVGKLVDAGHSIGNHTQDHRELEFLSPPLVSAQIERGQRSIIRAGAPAPSLFRPPKGFTDEAVGVLAEANRFRTVFWEFCVERFVNHQPVADGVDEILDKVRPGSIILAHDGGRIVGSGRPALSRRRTMEAVPLLLDGLARKGLRVVDVPTLLNAKP